MRIDQLTARELGDYRNQLTTAQLNVYRSAMPKAQKDLRLSKISRLILQADRALARKKFANV